VEIYIVVAARSDHDWSFVQNHDALILVADKKRITASNTSYSQVDTQPNQPSQVVRTRSGGRDITSLGQHGFSPDEQRFWEKMEFKISADDFRKLAFAQDIEGEIGGCQFTLPKDQIDAIHQVAVLAKLNRPLQTGNTAAASTQPSAMTGAMQKYHAAQDACIAKLGGQADYQQAKQAVADAQRQVDAAGDDKARTIAAAKVLAAKATVRRIEDAAFEADSEVTAAKLALDAAKANPKP
jgi:hypothetical protein